MHFQSSPLRFDTKARGEHSCGLPGVDPVRVLDAGDTKYIGGQKETSFDMVSLSISLVVLCALAQLRHPNGVTKSALSRMAKTFTINGTLFRFRVSGGVTFNYNARTTGLHSEHQQLVFKCKLGKMRGVTQHQRYQKVLMERCSYADVLV